MVSIAFVFSYFYIYLILTHGINNLIFLTLFIRIAKDKEFFDLPVYNIFVKFYFTFYKKENYFLKGENPVFLFYQGKLTNKPVKIFKLKTKTKITMHSQLH